MNLNLIIADNYKMVREGIKHLLQLDGSMTVVGEANDGKECLKLLKFIKADVLLLDIDMPNMNGIETLEKIKESKLPIKVIILTCYREFDYLMKAVELDVDGYLLKSCDIEELKHAIISVNDSRKYIQPDLIPQLNARMLKKNNEKMKVDSLTSREIEVLILLSNGLLNRDIAEKLNIREQTVKNHISNIFRKIDVSDRTQAAVFAIRNNIIHV